MSNHDFSRVAVLVTAFKRMASGQVRPVHGYFREVRASELSFRPDDKTCPLKGTVEIDLESFATDAEQRDDNVVAHLFGAVQTVTATIVPEGQILAPDGDDAWTCRGFVDLSLGARIPIALELRRRTLADRVEIAARLSHALDSSVTELGFPLMDFMKTVGVSSVIDRIELDVGIVFDEKASRRRVRVAIAGAGIAGLAAAQALVDAGCDVTILEKERFCGGKLTSHIDEAIGHTVEHGIHGVFPPYRNLVALWRDAGIDDSIFADTDTVGVATPSGIAAEKFHDMGGLAPISLLSMIPGGMLRARDLAASAAFLSRVYATADDRDELDRETFQSLLDRFGVSERMQRYLMHPYVKNLSYARPDQVSAAAACDALGYYLLENVDNFKARWLRAGPQELVIQPWVAELAKRGVRFVTGTPVRFVVFEKNRFQGFATRAVIPARTLGSQERAWTQRFGARVLALRWMPDKGELRAFDGLCTHAGCPLQPAGERGCNGFRCDCHGGAFDLEGRVMRAPPTRDLDPLEVEREEIGGEVFWKVALDGSSEGEGVLVADHGIVALDIEGAKKVLSANLLDLQSTKGISALRTTPVMVLRMWFRGVAYSGPDSGFFQADDLLDNFFVLNRFQREFREASGYTVVECHIGDCAAVEAHEDEHVLREAARCLQKYFPELGPDAIDLERSRVLRHREGFTMFTPGDASRTPSVAATDRENLFFAGDWVRSETRSWFMERAAVTGVEAANQVLAREGYEMRPLRVAGQEELVPKLLALPFRARDAIRGMYRAVIDGTPEAKALALPPSSPRIVAANPVRPDTQNAAPRARLVRGGDNQDASQAAVRARLVSIEDRESGTRLIAAERRFARPMVDLADLVTKTELDRIHPYVRDFYASPSDFDVIARLHVGPLLEQLVRGGLSTSPLYALGLLAGKSEGRAREYPVVMRTVDERPGHVRWDSLLVIDGAEIPLFTGHVGIVDGCLRQTLEGYGPPITLDLRARADADGVRFELTRATPMLLFAVARVSYTTHPMQHGVRIVCTYQHKLLRVERHIELEARRNAASSTIRDRRALTASTGQRSPPTLLPPARRRA